MSNNMLRRKNTNFNLVDLFNYQMLYKKFDHVQEAFFEDLTLYIIKGYQPLNSIKNIWLRKVVLQ